LHTGLREVNRERGNIQTAGHKGAVLDIHPALKDGDSLYRTAMPDRKNVLGRIDVAVVSDTTLTASPLSHSKPCDTSRPAIWQGATTATGLRGVCLVDFLKNNACVIK